MCAGRRGSDIENECRLRPVLNHAGFLGQWSNRNDSEHRRPSAVKLGW